MSTPTAPSTSGGLGTMAIAAGAIAVAAVAAMYPWIAAGVAVVLVGVLVLIKPQTKDPLLDLPPTEESPTRQHERLAQERLKRVQQEQQEKQKAQQLNPPAVVTATAAASPRPFASGAASGAASGSAAAVAAATAAAQRVAPAASGAADGGATGSVSLTGSAAILAKMRASRGTTSLNKGTAAAAAAGGAPLVTFAYASQTGTAQEIARSLHAEWSSKGRNGQVVSLNELGVSRMNKDACPVLVVVAASTGDGDPPDNSAVAYVALKKAVNNKGASCEGMYFTVLGLGDSNYTRFMAVPRGIKNALSDLGGSTFYDCIEADEVDGLEDIVDPWVAGLWGPLEALVGRLGGGGQGSRRGEAPPTAESSSSTAGLLDAITAPSSEDVGAPASATLGMQLSPSPSGARQNAAAAAAAAGVRSINAAASAAGAPALVPCRVEVAWVNKSDVLKVVRSKEAVRPTTDQDAYRRSDGLYTAGDPFWAKVTDAKLLTASWSDRRVVHLEVDLTGSGVTYAPGDSVGLLPLNDPQLVEALVQRLKLDGDAVFTLQAAEGAGLGPDQLLPHLGCPASVRGALLSGVDLTSPPRKSLLRLLAEYCSDAGERDALLHWCSKAGKDAYTEEVVQGSPTVLDLLSRFPSCAPPLAHLLDGLPPLAPRMYSITTSPSEHPQRLQVAFSTVNFTTKYGERKGVATHWLERLLAPWLGAAGGNKGVKVPLFLRPTHNFRPPQDPATPMIMIGPGTGVAPFRGFLQQRRAQLKDQGGKGGTTVLYFGCRRQDEDYLYQSDWEAFQADGTLSRLRTAFSRAQDSKVYVQHLVLEDAAEVAALIDGGAHVYVCGDGAAMAKDVHAALTDVLEQYGSSAGTKEAATAQLAAMTKAGTYVRDIWS